MEFDIVSDLNDGSADTTISVHETDTSYGTDAVNVNNQQPREAQQPKKITEQPADAAPKPTSLRDQISSALKSEAETPPAAKPDGGQARNPDGTFAAKVAADPAAPEPEQAAPATPVAAPNGIDPTVFASLPAETQASLARTMDDLNARQQRFSSLEPIEQLIAPRIDAWAMNGMAPAQAIHQLLALSDFAGRDPGGFIKYIAQQNGVDLEELVFGMDESEAVDPKYQQLQNQIMELQTHNTRMAQQQQQAVHNRTVDEVIAFADEKGQDGKPLRPYLSELGQSWLPYIGMVKEQNPNWSNAQVMQQAYENACWANTSVRAKMQQAAFAAAEAERLRKETARVSQAREASASVPSGTPTSPPAAPNDPSRSLRDTIRASMAAAE